MGNDWPEAGAAVLRERELHEPRAARVLALAVEVEEDLFALVVESLGDLGDRVVEHAPHGRNFATAAGRNRRRTHDPFLGACPGGTLLASRKTMRPWAVRPSRRRKGDVLPLYSVSAGFRDPALGNALSVDCLGSVHFDLADGTSLAVDQSDLGSVYTELWTLSSIPGAISTAALLLDEASRHPHYRHVISLNQAQSAALKSAVDHCAALSKQ